jgi:hypothetical protein
MCCHHTLDFPSFFDSSSSPSSLHVLCRVLVACSWLMSRENGRVRVSGGEKNGNEPPQAQVNTNGRQKPPFLGRPGPHSVSNFCGTGIGDSGQESKGSLSSTRRSPSLPPPTRHGREPIGFAFLSLLFAPSLRRASRPRLLMSGFNS